MILSECHAPFTNIPQKVFVHSKKITSGCHQLHRNKHTQLFLFFISIRDLCPYDNPEGTKPVFPTLTLISWRTFLVCSAEHTVDFRQNIPGMFTWTYQECSSTASTQFSINDCRSGEKQWFVLGYPQTNIRVFTEQQYRVLLGYRDWDFAMAMGTRRRHLHRACRRYATNRAYNVAYLTAASGERACMFFTPYYIYSYWFCENSRSFFWAGLLNNIIKCQNKKKKWKNLFGFSIPLYP